MTYGLRRAAALVCAALASCGDATPAVAGASDAREREAAALLYKARSAPVTTKVDLFRRVAALYDDLPVAAEAHYELILYLRLDPRETSDAAALRAAKEFAARRPLDPRVSGAFHLVAVKAIDSQDGVGDEALAAWRDWLLARFASVEPATDALYLDAATAFSLSRRWKDAAHYAEMALLSVDANDPAAIAKKVERSMFLGDLLAYRLGRIEEGRRRWFDAVMAAPEVVGAGVGGARSMSQADVIARLAKAPLATAVGLLNGTPDGPR